VHINGLMTGGTANAGWFATRVRLDAACRDALSFQEFSDSAETGEENEQEHEPQRVHVAFYTIGSSVLPSCSD